MKYLLLAALLVGCGNSSPAKMMPDAGQPPSPYIQIPAEPQRTGDPGNGYHALVNQGYVSCGIPYSLYQMYIGSARPEDKLDGRDGHSADLPYNQTAFTNADGMELVSENCLLCHASHINGQLVLGLGVTDQDFTVNPGQLATLAQQLTTDPAQLAALQKFAERLSSLATYTQVKTVGANPADDIAAVLFSHRDVSTLAWSHDPILPLPPNIVVPVDVPPWWRMKKKTSMFYNAAGRGDQARIMMTASTLCTDTVAEAQAIDAYFNDIAAWIRTIQPPAYPFPIDPSLAARGQPVFDRACSECHGTYGAQWTYPNLVVPTDLIGTDPLLASGAQFADQYIDWFSHSFYGQTARLEPQKGYIAPPLDGIWATAPFLHNGSVPTLAALLDSTTRPKYWTRSYVSTDYDPATVGWKFTALDHGQDGEPDAQKKITIYDTSLLGYGNGGHTYGDALSADDRSALLEYLKTL